MTIRSKPANKQYLDNWDKIFGKKTKEESSEKNKNKNENVHSNARRATKNK
jgi:hypothetical protein